MTSAAVSFPPLINVLGRPGGRGRVRGEGRAGWGGRPPARAASKAGARRHPLIKEGISGVQAVPCGAVSSDRSQMGPLLYGRLSFSAENSPSLLNVFKNLQILQVASCETEKVQPQNWISECVFTGWLSSSLYSFFSVLPPPSIFDPQDYPAAGRADLVGLGVPGRLPPHLRRRSSQLRVAPKAIRWVGARHPGRGGGSERPRQLGAHGLPPCGESGPAGR